MILLDSKKPLRKAYFDAIAHNLDWSNIPVRPSSNQAIYSKVPSKLDYPFIRFSTQTSDILSSTKTHYIHNNTIQLEIITGFHKSSGGFDVSDLITNQVFKAVMDKKNPLPIADPFSIVTSTLEFDESLQEVTNTDAIYRRVLRFRHLIDQGATALNEDVYLYGSLPTVIPFIVTN